MYAAFFYYSEGIIDAWNSLSVSIDFTDVTLILILWKTLLIYFKHENSVAVSWDE